MPRRGRRKHDPEHRDDLDGPIGLPLDEFTAVENHFQRHLGPIGCVYHEIVSDIVHVDVYRIDATDKRPYTTLVTMGMSAIPMSVPDGQDHLAFAELLLSLPRSWPLDDNAQRDERNYWPIRWLKTLARYPHEAATWLSLDHSIATDDPPRPVSEDAPFTGFLIFLPMLAPQEFWTLRASATRTINFFSVLPLYQEELDYKRRYSAKALLKRFDCYQITELVDKGRPNACARS